MFEDDISVLCSAGSNNNNDNITLHEDSELLAVL